MKDDEDDLTEDMFPDETNVVKFNPVKHLVTKSNSLIDTARITFTTMEQRVLHTALSQIAKGDKLTDQLFYEVPMATMADLIDREISGELYAAALAAARGLRRKEIKLKRSPSGKRLSKTLEISVVQSIAYDEGTVLVRFNSDAIGYLSGFDNKFTQFSIKNGLMQMESAYAYRLHDLIARWGDIGQKEIAIEDIRWMFGVDDKYPRFNSLRERVIEPAVADVNKHSAYHVKVGYRRLKRRVVALQFAFKPKAQPKEKEINAQVNLGELVHGVPKVILGSRLSGTARNDYEGAQKIKAMRKEKESWQDFYNRNRDKL